MEVRFNKGGCSNSTIRAYDVSGSLLASKSVSVSFPVLTGGTISNPTQSVGCGTTPALIQASVASGGSCSPTYYYQWQQSTDNVNFTDIPGATSQNYQPGPLTATTYFRRRVDCGCTICYLNNSGGDIIAQNQSEAGDAGATESYGSSEVEVSFSGDDYIEEMAVPEGFQPEFKWDEPEVPVVSNTTNYYDEIAYTTNTATVTVTALTGGGSINNTTQTINYNSAPAQITATAASGGTASYQWQQSANGTTYTDISGATSQNYQPGSLTTTMYYKRISTCGGTVLYSANVATVTVLSPPFNGGCITSGNQMISSGSTPASISASVPTGGTCGGSYSYQWMSSTDNIYFTNISGATSQNLSFSSGLTKTTYYQRKVTCGSQALITTSVTVTVN